MKNNQSQNNKLSYKGYTGSIEVSVEDSCLHGRILFIDDIVTYEGATVADIITSFSKAVDRYLAYCAKKDKPANKPYSGTFNVRVGQELHRKAVEVAHFRNITLNDFVAQSIKSSIEQNGIVKHQHSHQHNVTIVTVNNSETMVATMEKPHLWENISAIN